MLRSLKELEGYKVGATDGDLGHAVNVLLDDKRWVVRYLVVDTAGFFEIERDVLISPISFGKTEWAARRFNVNLTKDRVRRSPGLDTDKPVSRVRELQHAEYYGYPAYWGDVGIWGMGAYPSLLAGGPWSAPAKDTPGANDHHLRSAKELRGYHLHANDGVVGHLEDFVADDETWEVRYLVIATSNWWFGKRVLISPQWATAINWDERTVSVDLSRAAIRAAPEWVLGTTIDRAYEQQLYAAYGRTTYWADVPLSERPTAPRPEPHR
jgi:sporulation protein YlmC with PRC-barrel domain